MTFDYSKSAATALILLTKFGQDVILRSVTIGTYDPATGANAITTSDTTVKAAILDFGQGQTEQGGNLIQVGDKKCLMQAGTVPALQDVVVVGTKVYAVLSVGEVNPAGTPVLYTLHLRHG